MKSLFSKKILKKKRFWAILVLVIIILLVATHHKKPLQTATVTKGSVTETALLSGKAVTAERADLGFAASGRVQTIFVKNNQHVYKGQLLARLEIGDLLAERAETEGQSGSTIANENTKVENAYRALLSDDLTLTPDDTGYAVATPVISGLYAGEAGEYKIIIEKKTNVQSDMRTYGLERTGIEIDTEKPTKLGTRGLFVSFPDGINTYGSTAWYLEIPNTKGASYGSNYNAWKAAVTARDRALADTGNTQLQKIDAEIRKNSVYAPFTGTVTNIEKQVGESVTSGEQVISMLGDGNLEIVLQVPELDVSKLAPNADISITFDAIKGETFAGKLETINSRDTEIDGVPVYEAFVEIKSDPRIKSGMTAYGSITVGHKDDVLTIPIYVLTKKDKTYIAQVMVGDKKIEEKEVTVGLIGSDSMAEVAEGLAEGDVVVSYTAKK